MPLNSVGLDAYIGHRVRVYRNLVKKCISVQAKLEKTWKVIGYCQSVTLRQSNVVISKSGQMRARQQHTRNVHLYLEGILHSECAVPVAVPIVYDEYSYNPFENETLTCVANQKSIATPIIECTIQKGRVFVLNRTGKNA